MGGLIKKKANHQYVTLVLEKNLRQPSFKSISPSAFARLTALLCGAALVALRALHEGACKGNFSTTRLIIPSSDGESGKRPSSRQRKKAKSCATTTCTVASLSSPSSPNP